MRTKKMGNGLNTDFVVMLLLLQFRIVTSSGIKSIRIQKLKDLLDKRFCSTQELFLLTMLFCVPTTDSVKKLLTKWLKHVYIILPVAQKDVLILF